MKKSERIQAISQLQSTGDSVELLYDGKKRRFNLFDVPLDMLLFNKYNGRIYSRTKSLENTTGKILDLENQEDFILIQKLLLDSAPARNEHTYLSILKHGQLEYGIITKDGIIIDGNRRAAIINKINKEQDLNLKFRAVLLDDELDKKEREITDLETFYQIGVDGKVDYNPIEKYLKCEYLLKYHTHEEVSNLMSETISRIKEWEKILALMNEYLHHHNIIGEYTKLDKREGHFVDLIVYLRNYDLAISKSSNVDWDYTLNDLEYLKVIYFDYILSGMPVAQCRIIAKSANGSGFFCHKKIWYEFKENHSRKLKEIDSELSTHHLDKDELLLLKSKLISEATIDGFSLATIQIQSIKSAKMPLVLLKRANNALNGINIENVDYKDENFIQLMTEIDSNIKRIKNG